ncbi:unnamed protein product [Diplocarpon coronariae]
MASALPKRFAILLQAGPGPWETINAIRAKYPAARDKMVSDTTRSEVRLPYLPFVPKLPPRMLEHFQKELPAFASLQKPFSVEIRQPLVTHREFASAEEDYGLSWALDVEPLNQFRSELWKKFQDLLPEDSNEKFARKMFCDPRETASLTIRTSNMGLTKAQADEALSELQGNRHGFKSIDIVGLALQQYTKPKNRLGKAGTWGLQITEERMLGKYAFGGESQP